MASEPVALALDLGTTRVKVGVVDSDGRLSRVRAVDSPPTLGTGLVRNGDPEAWREVTLALVRELDLELGRELPIGLSSQRSSFLFVDRATGAAASPLVSWQDRTAAPWCQAHHAAAARVSALSGLVLSPHYVGPKLAQRFELDPSLRAACAGGATVVRTLDAWIQTALEPCEDARNDPSCAARTDLSCAARTALVDFARRDYSDELLELFGVPRIALAPLAPSVEPRARRVRAHVADQAAAALAVLGESPGGALISLGTGGFVLVATGAEPVVRPPYLGAPVLARDAQHARYVLEGTINGGGATADRFARPPTRWPIADPTPDEFCMPDENGWGAPFWRAERSLRFSGATRVGTHADLRRVVVEGLCFRAAAILADLSLGRPVTRVALAGGLAHDPFVPRALVAILERPIELVGGFEAGLAAAGRLAAGLEPRESDPPVQVEPALADDWLRAKYERWRGWVATLD
ncbi:MAG: hypothetical protein HZA52_02190 [Planctomycetes bacterium]|nr:hypothetical protein [Planctomycetota bacterium]